MMLAALFLGLLSQSADPERQERPPIVAYSGGVLDLSRNLERFILTREAIDCSTTTHWCVDGDVMRLAIEKRCREYRIGESVTVGAVSATILNADTTALGQRYVRGQATQPLYLLGDPSRPWVVYAYERSGVTSLFSDATRRLDLV